MTVCSGSDVLVRCGYLSTSLLPVTWIINGTPFDQSAIDNSPLYQLNNPTTPRRVSLTVFSINHITTFQCVVQSTSSRIQTVTVTTGTYVCMYSYVYRMCIIQVLRVCVHVASFIHKVLYKVICNIVLV